ncbi:ribosomal protection-like ABC-F family protein [Paenibacillus kandeliae]|uniref:ribosomal protection-like ABC-F family protein n=1 Tax=Paenibacillus kandeliae TaxID=3231269 RepID=UPI003458E56D
MTTWVKVRNLAKDWNGKMIFEQVNLQIESDERLALIGVNGSGKTTLIRMLMGEEHVTEGEIERFLPLQYWDWMRQQDDQEQTEGMTVLEMARQGKSELWSLRRQLDQDEAALSDDRWQADEQGVNELLAQYSQRLEQYEQLDGFVWETEVEKQLTTLGIDSQLWTAPYGSLSGGQKTRVRLAAVLTRDTRLLILDEPTNHLDVETMEWLEKRLRQYTGALLFVSHDREFVDRLATSVAELTPQGMTVYKGGYRDYREHKERELQAQQALYKKQEQQRKALEESIRRYKEWFDKAHAAAGKQNEVKITASFYKAKAKKNISRYHAKQKEMERLEAVRVDKPREADRLNFQLESSEFRGHTLLELRDVSFDYGERNPAIGHLTKPHEPLLQHLHLSLHRGDRLAVTGPNGSGKTTLLRILMGSLEPKEGVVYTHPALQIGYFSQELEDLPLDMTLLDSLLVLPGMTRTEAQTILGCFLFRREDVHKVIGQLSMGEKCRAALIRLYFGGANLLILDEPTNYLDIAAQEVIESVLSSFSGTIVLVSHDRMLVRRLANTLLLLDGHGQHEVFEGSMEEYEQFQQRLRQQEQSGGREADERRMLLELRLSQLMAATENGQQVNDNATHLHSADQNRDGSHELAQDQNGNDKQKSIDEKFTTETIPNAEQRLWSEIRQLRNELERYKLHNNR